MIKDLNELKDEDVFCWCNAAGDIMLPADPFFVSRRLEELPPAIQQLAEKYWTDTNGYNMRIETIKGIHGVSLGLLFCDGFIDDIAEEADYCGRHLRPLSEMALDDIVAWLSGELPDEISIFVGKGTDPDGDELVVFVPEKLCSQFLVPDCVLPNGDEVYTHFKQALFLYLKDDMKRYSFGTKPTAP